VDSRPLTGTDVTLYRSGTMRCCYLGPDRPEIQYGAKEYSRWMQSPIASHLEDLKRVVRFLKGHRRLVQTFVAQDPVYDMICRVDSNHAACPVTRKSTTCVHMMHGENCIKTASSTQAVLGLSTGESEFHGLVRACSMCSGGCLMASDIGETLKAKVYGDSTAAKGIGSRSGIGKVRHVHLLLLWIQDFVRKKLIQLIKKKGTELTADLGTKHVT